MHLSFNVHGIIYVQDDGEMQPIEREIRDLAASLQAIKDEQEYLVIRERVHRNSAYDQACRGGWRGRHVAAPPAANRIGPSYYSD